MQTINRFRGRPPTVWIAAVGLLLLTGGSCVTGEGGEGGDRTSAPAVPEEISRAYFAEESCCEDDRPCQDGLFCNGRETCNCWGECEPPDPTFNPCYDGDPCTSDTCDELRDRCPRTPLPGPGCPCSTSADCNDSNRCTVDICDAGSARCTYNPVTCVDSDICTADSCVPAVGCVFTTIPDCCRTNADCEDGNPCTTNTCTVATGRCVTANVAAGTACPADTNPCTDDYCNGAGACIHPLDTTNTCADDGNPCTRDNCSTGACYGPAPATTVCRAVAGVCDVEERCDGTTTVCPANRFVAAGTVCRAATGVCDVQETCTGAEAACPANGFQPDGPRAGCNAMVGECAQQQCRAGACTNVALVGARCDYSAIDMCRNPGVCDATGLCQAGPSGSAANDVCTGIVTLPLDPATGDACVEGTTTCSAHNYAGTCGGASRDVVYRFGYTVGSAFQLYSYNAYLDGAGWDTVLYAQGTCGIAPYRPYCNDNCADVPLHISCAGYGLSAYDSAFNYAPTPVGVTNTVDLVVDGMATTSYGSYRLCVDRIHHMNWRCAGLFDATGGGVFRGNITGFENNVSCSAGGHVGNPCDCNGGWSPCGDSMWGSSTWPARAWFSLRPATATTYCLWTDELAPGASAFDTVVEVWRPDGCPGYAYYQTCRHVAAPATPTRVQITLAAGEWRMVGVSRYCAGSGGDAYELHIDIGACP